MSNILVFGAKCLHCTGSDSSIDCIFHNSITFDQKQTHELSEMMFSTDYSWVTTIDQRQIETTTTKYYKPIRFPFQ